MVNKIIAVMGKPDVAVELASVISTHSENSVLIMDMDTLHPSLDLILKVNQHPKDINAFDEKELNTGLNLVIDAVDKNLLSKEFLFKCLQNKRKNLYILTGNHSVANYQYMRDEPVKELLQKVSEIFSIVVLAVSSDIYDSYTNHSIERSDVVIVPVLGDLADIRNFNNDLNYSIEKNSLDPKKFIQVLFDFEMGQDTSVALIKQVCRFRFGGIIPRSKLRNNCHNNKNVYIKCMEQQVIKQYKKIAANCGINVSKPFVNRPKKYQRLSNYFSRRNVFGKGGKGNGK